MPRIKLKPQPAYEFQHRLSVRVTDLNYGAHLANNAVVELIHEARVQLLRQLGLSEHNLGDGQTGIIMGDLVVNFKQEGFLGDELCVESHIGEVAGKGFRLFHRITRGTELLALAETGIVCFDYAARKIAPIPPEFLQAIKRRTGELGANGQSSAAVQNGKTR